ncbi:MAG: arsenic efflux protein [Ignavibacteriaceae bacterium]|nr:arsenic efflux protein [Ignavibacterium sp.]MCC6253668.1 arsenic efflux protein [Ignavibacteriaceae bacterium]HRN26001.1 putative manganese transporter [Ignavibacteriaceae bacterium]HRP91355.1 putative manganese transporter [Ignavibacteriaceae bacterium]HRQ53621.1 putative manganese transporter [Ignavibacteriaceae bacterium]
MHVHSYSNIWEIILGSFTDTYLMIPILFSLYFALEYFSHTKQLDLISFLKISGPMGPLAGTLLGLIPECGMSVFVTSLFLTRRVSIGTLIATYLATSDEALPVLIANREHGIYILYILGIKLLIGVTSGYLIDLLISKKFYEGKTPKIKSSHAVKIDVELHKTRYMEIIIHSLKRTLRIYFWVFVITIAIASLFAFTHSSELIESLNVNPVIEIFAAALFGLIPNCAASIAIAQAFLHTGLSLGATIAGLSSGAGFGPIVLFKDGEIKTSAKILILTLVSAISWGLIVNFVF